MFAYRRMEELQHWEMRVSGGEFYKYTQKLFIKIHWIGGWIVWGTEWFLVLVRNRSRFVGRSARICCYSGSQHRCLRLLNIRAAAYQLRQDKHHETKDAVLLHSWFRLESAHRSSTCLRLVTSSLVDDMTSPSEEDILMYMWLKLYEKSLCSMSIIINSVISSLK
jgi:hypothetical protein